MGQRLGDKHPVERVSVVIGQGASQTGIGMGDGKGLEIVIPYIKDGIIDPQLSASTLDADFPNADCTHIHDVVWIGDRRKRLRGYPPLFAPPQENVGVE